MLTMTLTLAVGQRGLTVGLEEPNIRLDDGERNSRLGG